jgi:Flp pilus assembly pilin Flp
VFINDSDGQYAAPTGMSFFTEVNVVLDRLSRVHEEAGQTMAEYAVVLAVITIAVVVTLGLLSSAISSQLNSVIGIL